MLWSALVFFFHLHDSGFQRASELHRGKTLWMLIAGFLDEMWMLQQPNKKFNFPSRPIKCPAWQEVQPPCFLLICTSTPDHWHPKLRIKFDQMKRFNLFCFLGGKKCSSICPEKATENSNQIVSALLLQIVFTWPIVVRHAY